MHVRSSTRLATCLTALALAAATAGSSLMQPPASAAAETCWARPATLVGTPGGTVTGTERPDVVVTYGAGRVVGLGGDDVVCVTGPATTVDIDTGSGNDVVEMEAADPSTALDLRLGEGDDQWSGSRDPAPGTTIDGGPGTDSVQVVSTTADLHLDLRRDVLTVDDAQRHDVVVAGVEDAFLTARRVVADGSDEWNRLEVTACRAVVRGHDGEDVVLAPYSPGFEDLWDCVRSVKILGGHGTDLLVGAPGNDVVDGGRGNDDVRGGDGRDLVRGGPGRDSVNGMAGPDRMLGGSGADFVRGVGGRDTADGGLGRDTCRAERAVRCER